MSSRLALFSRGIIAGALLMYFVDPRRGRQRRARAANYFSHLARAERQLLDKAARDARYRAMGAFQRIRHPSAEADDWVIEQRVRAVLGRIVPYSSSIETDVTEGIATLRGPVLAEDASPVIRRLRAIRGVHAVVDHLDRHAARDLPGLKRDRKHRGDHWSPAVQAAAVVGGALIATYGIAIRRGGLGALLFGAGAAVVTRGAVNLPFRRIAGYLSGRDAISVRKTIFVACPIERVFAAWSHLENLPRFMEHVRSLEIDPGEPKRARWTVDGPAGIALEFETMTTRIDPEREIAWTTLPGQRIQHSGTVHFTSLPKGTRVQIDMTYRPPGGALAHALAHILGWDPKARIDDDMLRMKALLEQGHTRAHGGWVTEAALVH